MVRSISPSAANFSLSYRFYCLYKIYGQALPLSQIFSLLALKFFVRHPIPKTRNGGLAA
jgi:hypothetical protein